MSTRSMIAQAQKNGTVRAVYCHGDGYPEHNGRLLNEYWTEQADVAELIEGGDMSSLGATLSTCKFYAQAGDEDSAYIMAGEFNSYADFLTSIGNDIEYVYVMLRTGKWAMADVRSGNARPLSDVLAAMNRTKMHLV